MSVSLVATEIFLMSVEMSVYSCMFMFNCVDIEDIMCSRKKFFLQKHCLLDNIVCALFRHQADFERETFLYSIAL